MNSSLSEDAPRDVLGWRAMALVGLAVGEVLAAAVVGRRWWYELFGSAEYLKQLTATLAVCLAVFSGRRILAEVTAVGKGRRSTPWLLAGAQVAAYLLFTWLTLELAGGGDAGRQEGWWYTAAWVATGVGAVGLWLFAFLPPAGWVRLPVRLRWEFGLVAGLAATVWAAGRAARYLWGPLADTTLRAVEVCLGAVYPDVVCDPARRVVGTTGFRIHIADACSGYEGFGLVTTVVLSYLVLCRRQLRFPAALALLPLGVAASWAANVLRISALVGVGVVWRPEVAVAGFHTQAGWLGFCVVALGVVALGRFLPACRRNAHSSPVDQQTPTVRAAPFVVPLMAVVGTGMLTAAFSDGGPDRLYGLRVLAGGLAVWVYRREYARLVWGWSWLAVGVGLGVFVVWAGLARLFVTADGESPLTAIETWPVWERVVWVLSRVLGAVVIVPLVEELAFRGYLFRRLGGLGADGESIRWRWLPGVISALVFGLLHPDHWIAGTIAGFAYSWMTTRRGRVADAVLAHGVTNLILLAYVALTGRWADW